jgi:hypothetical protein
MFLYGYIFLKKKGGSLPVHLKPMRNDSQNNMQHGTFETNLSRWRGAWQGIITPVGCLVAVDALVRGKLVGAQEMFCSA